MRYVVRADASKIVGAGHAMRSSAIAEELIEQGEEVVFVGNVSELDWVQERILQLGFIETYSDSSDFIANPNNDVLILDSYNLAIKDQFVAHQNWYRIIVIADELTPDYACDLRIHPGLDADWVGDSKYPVLSGPKFIPLRKSLKQGIRNKKSNVDSLQIAVVAGGSDPFNLIEQLAKILERLDGSFEVFLFSNDSKLRSIDSRLHFVPIGIEMEVITKQCDLVITTASTSCLEFLARGFPIGVIRLLDNQDQYFNVLGEAGVAVQLGFRSDEGNLNIDISLLAELIRSEKLRETLIQKSSKLIDFEGSKRIVTAIRETLNKDSWVI
jgi:spore coat polysaccharide biosynthesis predicted glycosyltransferase SpsG